ncbi:ABC transporter permease [Oryzobacter telluris]|uniref:ABC transporter permease n=1 Tax=Oryzobacter telluris TaxID=3149179 RepID=UPI00370DAD7A
MSTPIRPTTIAVASGRLAPGPRPELSVLERMVAVTGHHLLVYKRTWKGSIIGRFLTPLMFMLSMGLGIGTLVDRGAGGIEGMPYFQYAAPALVAVQAMWLAFGESTYTVMGYLKWNEMYAGMLATPLRVVEVLGGHLLVVGFHLFTGTLIFVGVAALFGAFTSWWALAAIPIATLTGMAFATPTFALSASLDSDNGFGVLNRFVMTPLMLFSGVFFPIDAMPTLLQVVAWLTPLWHGVELCRDAATGTWSPGSALVHLGVLAVWLVGGWLLAAGRFTRRLRR